MNTSIQNDVASSNQDLSQIAALNQQIVLAQAGGGTANDLVDTREQTIENLAGLVNISTTAQANGSVNISIGGVPMVTGGNAVDGLQTYDAGGGQLLIQDENSAATLAVTGGSIGGNITVRDGALAGLQTSLDTLASQLITQVNNIYSAGYDAGGGTGQKFFTGAGAADIGVNSALVSDPSQFQVSSAPGAGGDTQIALSLANLASQDNSALGNQSLTQSYAQTVSNLGNAINTATDQLNTSQAISTNLANQRSSESGVSIDEEMTNLMQFQKAYEASAQLVTTLNAMMETVINMKTAYRPFCQPDSKPMRISTSLFTNNLLAQMNQLQGQQIQLQNQATTGLKVTLPEDDPAAMDQVLDLQTQAAANTQYQSNITQLQSTATTAASAMNSLQTITEQAGEIATEAGGVNSSTQLATYATASRQSDPGSAPGGQHPGRPGQLHFWRNH